jgi:hypothetical protein
MEGKIKAQLRMSLSKNIRWSILIAIMLPLLGLICFSRWLFSRNTEIMPIHENPEARKYKGFLDN